MSPEVPPTITRPFANHPLWSVGFRPFFALACLSGAVLPPLWALIFTGRLTMPSGPLSPVQWHAHEMFYGFGWAVLGGFLLTATKNWVGVRGYHGAPLALLAAAWLVERLGIALGGAMPTWAFWLAANLFLVTLVGMLLNTLIANRATDSFRTDNVFFLAALPLFVVAKNLVLVGDTFALGVAMSLSLFRLAFLVMLERTVTQFMKGTFQAEILRSPALDVPIKVLGLALVFGGWLPSGATTAGEGVLAALLLVRFAAWKPHVAVRRLDVLVMYLGYAGIVAQLLLDVAQRLHVATWVGSVHVHTFTFGVMGLVIPAMIVRISNGHTGRKVVFGTVDKAVLLGMIAAFVLRVLGPQWAPAAYAHWVEAAAVVWAGGFAVLGARFLPYWLAARIDGKPH